MKQGGILTDGDCNMFVDYDKTHAMRSTDKSHNCDTLLFRDRSWTIDNCKSKLVFSMMPGNDPVKYFTCGTDMCSYPGQRVVGSVKNSVSCF